MLIKVFADQVFLQFLGEVSAGWICVDMPDDEQQLVVVGGIHIVAEGLQGEVDHLLREVVVESIDGYDCFCDLRFDRNGSGFVLEF